MGQSSGRSTEEPVETPEAPKVTSKELLAAENCFYMNFKLLNLDEAFPKIMRAKLRSSGKGDRAVELAGKVGHFIAKKPKFGKKFSNTIAEKLTDLMPQQLEENGISFRLTQVHCGEMGFVVLRAEVVEVDVLKLLEKAKGTKFADKLAPLVGVARWFRDIDRDIVPKVQQQVMLKMEEEIPSKMWENAHFKMLMICKTSAEQAEFFFDALAPHNFEIVVTVPNKSEDAPKIAEKNAKGYFGDKIGRGKYLGMLAGKIASCSAAKANDERFSKMITRSLAQVLPEYLAEVGVVLTVKEGFASKDETCSTVLRCSITDVDLDLFRASATIPSSIAQDQHILRLGHKGRSEVYEAIRGFIQAQFPLHLQKQLELQAEVVVRDVTKSEPAEMAEIEGLSDSDIEGETSGGS